MSEDKEFYFVVQDRYLKLLRCRDAAFLLTQCLMWSSTKHDGWFYKSAAEWAEPKNGAWTRRTLDAAKNKLIDAGVLMTDVRGVPATTHFKIDTKALETALEGTTQNDSVCTDRTNQFVQNVQTSLNKTSKLDCTERTNQFDQNVQASLYKTYQLVCTPRTSLFVRSVQTITSNQQVISKLSAKENKKTQDKKNEGDFLGEDKFTKRQTESPPAPPPTMPNYGLQDFVSRQKPLHVATDEELDHLYKTDRKKSDLYHRLRSQKVDIAHDDPRLDLWLTDVRTALRYAAGARNKYDLLQGVWYTPDELHIPIAGFGVAA